MAGYRRSLWLCLYWSLWFRFDNATNIKYCGKSSCNPRFTMLASLEMMMGVVWGFV